MIQVGDSVVIVIEDSILNGVVGVVVDLDPSKAVYKVVLKVSWVKGVGWFGLSQLRLYGERRWDSEAI